jgi:hypothetical protein
MSVKRSERMYRKLRVRRYGVGVLVLGLCLLASMASAASITITEVDGGLVTGTGAGFDPSHPFTTHPGPPNIKAIGFHGEWNTTDITFAGLLPGQSYTLNFNFCEIPGIGCPGGLANATQIIDILSLPPSGTIIGPIGLTNPLNSDGTCPTPIPGVCSGGGHPLLADFSITLIDNSSDGDLSVPLFGIPNLSHSLSLTFTRQLGSPSVSVDGDFHSASDVPEPASLLLLGTGLVGVGLKNRRKRQNAAA